MVCIEQFVCNPFQEQCYVVWDEVSRHCLVIDPGMSCDAEWSRVHRFLIEHQLTPERILLTHGHTDHVMGAGYLTKAYPGVKVCGSMEEQNHLPTPEVQNQFFGIETEVHYAAITDNVMAGDTFRFPSEGGESIQVIDVPGHSHHGLCYYLPQSGVIFSGDVLFYCSVGRSDFGPSFGGNGPLLVRGILERLLTLPMEVKVYPGHGPMTTIGNEATYNPYL